MVENNVDYFVFSSTAAVYGEPEAIPIVEEHPTNPENVYGESKLFFEKILKRYDQIHGLKYISLRYFNAAGADPEAKIGEAHDPETHLIPIVLQTALGIRDKIYIFGDDYPTKDGSCVRDYIHVNDLADAHLLAVEALADGENSDIYNLGCGDGYSVKEVIETAKKVTQKDFEVEVSERRAGDPAVLIASSEKIKNYLGWQPKYQDLEKIISTAWEWHKSGGFRDE
jgi:UDP-glucose 4-epimerase